MGKVSKGKKYSLWIFGSLAAIMLVIISTTLIYWWIKIAVSPEMSKPIPDLTNPEYKYLLNPEYYSKTEILVEKQAAIISWISATATALLSLFAIIVSAYAVFLSVKQSKESHRHTRQELRAYLCAKMELSNDNPGIDRSPVGKIKSEEERYISVDYILENMGQTPARKIQVFSWISIASKKRDPKHAFEIGGTQPLKNNGYDIELGSKCEIIPPTAYLEFSNEVVSMLVNGEAELIVRGKVDYEDVFGEKHQLEFGWSYEIEHGEWQPKGDDFRTITG